MEVSISNIAWDIKLDDDVAALLNRYAVKNIDIAPPKYFPSPESTTEQEILQVKNHWLQRGISIIGMQSLLFGTTGLNVFSNYAVQQEMLLHLSHIFRIAQQLNAKKMVFGSPRNRDCSHLNEQETLAVAVDFFSRLGNIAQSYGVTICLEPNPNCYNCNFMTNSLETSCVVALVDHPNIKMQLDVGAMFINNEDPNLIIPKVAHLIAHIHISEPQLAVLNPSNNYHALVARLINKYLPDKTITIEMLTSGENTTLDEIEKSLEFVAKTYRRESCL